MKKSKLFRTSLKFLGHVVSTEGVHMDLDKTEGVHNFPGWYHRFIPDFASIAEPLNALKRKGAKFIWSPACQAAFDKLKQCLVSPPVLGHLNFDVPFLVYLDASGIGIGVVLVQKSSTGTEELLAFASRSLNSADRH